MLLLLACVAFSDQLVADEYPVIKNAVQVAVSDPAFSHAGCYLDDVGRVFCWGGATWG